MSSRNMRSMAQVDLGDQVDRSLLVDPDVAAEARHHGSPARTTASMARDDEQRIARGNH